MKSQKRAAVDSDLDQPYVAESQLSEFRLAIFVYKSNLDARKIQCATATAADLTVYDE